MLIDIVDNEEVKKEEGTPEGYFASDEAAMAVLRLTESKNET